MISQKITVKNVAGLHARPATLLVKEASKYQSDITIVKNDREGNAKSILGVMAMAAKKGDEIEIRVDGSDEKEALAAIITLFEFNFGEE
ncbi:phosphocarrier protein [Anaerovirgula multivorans]|uniref:Phosphocarrier protein HPr n=1 Tax=Anaerovirgula multivorans TaxID=312168 RepID=A0A239IX11_9FIRM|nr:HPr family phosphocarrier protein [Anaerovirgula multivorans]SNS98141.1 phosphocarrier protein [Anaerovirgula multivorans]